MLVHIGMSCIEYIDVSNEILFFSQMNWKYRVRIELVNSFDFPYSLTLSLTLSILSSNNNIYFINKDSFISFEFPNSTMDQFL